LLRKLGFSRNKYIAAALLDGTYGIIGVWIIEWKAITAKLVAVERRVFPIFIGVLLFYLFLPDMAWPLSF
jgi:hypothetical protein